MMRRRMDATLEEALPERAADAQIRGGLGYTREFPVEIRGLTIGRVLSGGDRP